MYGRTEDYSPKKDKVYKVIQAEKGWEECDYLKMRSGATDISGSD